MTEPIQFPAPAVYFSPAEVAEDELDCFCEEMHDGLESIKADMSEIKAMLRHSETLLATLLLFNAAVQSAAAKEQAIANAIDVAIAELPWYVRIFV
jgi:hypothetical protein